VDLEAGEYILLCNLTGHYGTYKQYAAFTGSGAVLDRRSVAVVCLRSSRLPGRSAQRNGPPRRRSVPAGGESGARISGGSGSGFPLARSRGCGPRPTRCAPCAVSMQPLLRKGRGRHVQPGSSRGTGACDRAERPASGVG
jgi:hypothetical protein